MSTANEKMEKAENAATVLGLDTATDRKDAEYNLVKSLLKAKNYKTDENVKAEIAIERNKEYFFTVHLRPIGERELQEARRKATKYIPNPQGARYPKLESGFDSGLFNSWLIYLATTEEDRKKIWGDKTVMADCGVNMPVETIDELLLLGEKSKLTDMISRISGLEVEEGTTQEEYAKKS